MQPSTNYLMWTIRLAGFGFIIGSMIWEPAISMAVVGLLLIEHTRNIEPKEVIKKYQKEMINEVLGENEERGK